MPYSIRFVKTIFYLVETKDAIVLDNTSRLRYSVPTMNENKGAKKMHKELVICTNGERFETRGTTDRGVEFDGGLVPWNEVDGFMCWSSGSQRWMFVPV